MARDNGAAHARSCPCAAAAGWPAPCSPVGPPGYEVCAVRDMELPLRCCGGLASARLSGGPSRV